MDESKALPPDGEENRQVDRAKESLILTNGTIAALSGVYAASQSIEVTLVVGVAVSVAVTVRFFVRW